MKQAERRKFHYIYKITRTDGKYYIGMHSTDDLEDGYFGSGQLLWKSIKKHGKEKHVKEILEFLPSRKELKERERALVNEEIVNDPLCMNLKLGGEGGWDHITTSPFSDAVVQQEMSKRGNEKLKQLWQDPAWSAERKLSMSKAALNRKSPGFSGKHHSEETKQKMRKPRNQGVANSQFGTCWVTNGTPAKIKKEELDMYISNGYRRGRK